MAWWKEAIVWTWQFFGYARAYVFFFQCAVGTYTIDRTVANGGVLPLASIGFTTARRTLASEEVRVGTLSCSCNTLHCSCNTLHCSCSTLHCSCNTLHCSCNTLQHRYMYMYTSLKRRDAPLLAKRFFFVYTRVYLFLYVHVYVCMCEYIRRRDAPWLVKMCFFRYTCICLFLCVYVYVHLHVFIRI